MSDNQRSRVEELLGQLDAAYASGDWHSLRGNLADVPVEAWDWVPPGAARSIREIVRHLGGCKLMYENQGFGDAALDWDDSLVTGEQAAATIDGALTWLDDAHERLRARIAMLTDAELDRERAASLGEMKPTRWIITTMIHHDVYHAGEINHLRSLYTREDRWAHDIAVMNEEKTT